MVLFDSIKGYRYLNALSFVSWLRRVLSEISETEANGIETARVIEQSAVQQFKIKYRYGERTKKEVTRNTSFSYMYPSASFVVLSTTDSTKQPSRRGVVCPGVVVALRMTKKCFRMEKLHRKRIAALRSVASYRTGTGKSASVTRVTRLGFFGIDAQGTVSTGGNQ